MKLKQQEVKTRVAVRRKPGDRWSALQFSTDVVVPSLTEMLELIYQETGTTQFYIDAREGRLTPSV